MIGQTGHVFHYWLGQKSTLVFSFVMSCNPDHSTKQKYMQTPNSEHQTPNSEHQTLNSEHQTLNSKPQTVTLDQIAIHSGLNLSIWISLLHPYISYCLIVLVVLTLAYVPWLLYPFLYCLTLVPFWMYLAMTLPSCLMFCLARNYKVPTTCNHSAVWISKSSGYIPCTIKTCPHSDSVS